MTIKSWQEKNLRPGSFRGIAFEVDGADKTFGPRTITHEFPLRDDVTHEFIGKLPRAFSLEMLLIGDDVLDLTAKLEEALDQTEPGRLVHPWYGELDVVVVGEVRTRTSTREGRVARITAQFQLTGSEQSPVIATDTKAAVDTAADAAGGELLADFLGTYVGEDVMDFVLDHAGEVTARIVTMTVTLTRAAGLGNLLADGQLATTAATLLDGGDELLGNAAALGQAVTGLFTSTAKPTRALGDTLLTLGGRVGIDALQIPVRGVTPSWKRAEINRDAVKAAATIQASIAGVTVGKEAGWESRDQAMAWRDVAADNLDLAADIAGAREWDATWRAVTDLRAAMVKDVAKRAAPLPRLGVMVPNVTTPAVVLAYRLDGDDLATLFDRSADLQQRNRIRHPGFVAGGDALEVLLDA